MANPAKPTFPLNRIIPEGDHIEIDGKIAFLNGPDAVAFVANLVALNAIQTYGIGAATQAQMQAGTLATLLAVSPLLVAQAIAALAPGAAPVQSVAGLTGAILSANLKTALGLVVADISGAAPIASPALSGTPTAPTASGGTNTTQLATTAFVAAAVAALINSAPGALDTLKELADAMGDDANFAATMATALAAKAPLASPSLGGTPTAPTATPGTNTIQLATTAFVLAAIAASSPVLSVAGLSGVIAASALTTALSLVVGDISGAAPLASPALTGTPTAPTASNGTSTTQLATTAFAGNAANLTTGTIPVARFPALLSQYVGYVSASGNNSTAALNNPDLPYLTVAAALTAGAKSIVMQAFSSSENFTLSGGPFNFYGTCTFTGTITITNATVVNCFGVIFGAIIPGTGGGYGPFELNGAVAGSGSTWSIDAEAIVDTMTGQAGNNAAKITLNRCDLRNLTLSVQGSAGGQGTTGATATGGSPGSSAVVTIDWSGGGPGVSGSFELDGNTVNYTPNAGAVPTDLASGVTSGASGWSVTNTTGNVTTITFGPFGNGHSYTGPSDLGVSGGITDGTNTVPVNGNDGGNGGTGGNGGLLALNHCITDSTTTFVTTPGAGGGYGAESGGLYGGSAGNIGSPGASGRIGFVVKDVMSAIRTTYSIKANTTTPVDDDVLLLYLPPGRYHVQALIIASGASGTPGLTSGFAFSGTKTNESGTMTTGDSNLSGGGIYVSDSGDTNFEWAAWTLSATNPRFLYDFTFTVTAAGVLSYQWAQAVSSSDDMYLLASSGLTVTRISP